jgi:hypothetical protein
MRDRHLWPILASGRLIVASAIDSKQTYWYRFFVFASDAATLMR